MGAGCPAEVRAVGVLFLAPQGASLSLGVGHAACFLTGIVPILSLCSPSAPSGLWHRPCPTISSPISLPTCSPRPSASPTRGATSVPLPLSLPRHRGCPGAHPPPPHSILPTPGLETNPSGGPPGPVTASPATEAEAPARPDPAQPPGRALPAAGTTASSRFLASPPPSPLPSLPGRK